jgi:hypothetical protein
LRLNAYRVISETERKKITLALVQKSAPCRADFLFFKKPKSLPKNQPHMGLETTVFCDFDPFKSTNTIIQMFINGNKM